MAENNLAKKGYLPKLTASFRKLWSAQEILLPRNIRKSHLQYFFAFPLAMSFINIQDFVVGDGIFIFGLAQTTITYIAFALGAIIMFAVSKKNNIVFILKISAVLTAIGFIPWFFLKDGYLSLLFSVVFMAGVGGCLSGSSFSFVFILNNTERFFGSTLMVLFIDLVEISAEYFSLPLIIIKILTLIIIVSLCFCMFLSKSQDYACTENRAVKKTDPSIWLVLFIFFSYFAIRITGFYAPAFQHPSGARLWGIAAFVLIVCCIILHVVFKRSIWLLCNVFFIASVLSNVMWYIKLPSPAYLFSELKEVGLIITFYLLGCVTNKFCNFRMHKRLVMLCMAVTGVLYFAIDALHMTVYSQTVVVITTGVMLVVFLLLSPVFSQYLFFADWSKELRQVDMTSPIHTAAQTETPNCSQVNDTNLSPREKQVVLLLLQGMTLRQTASELGLTPSTVSTYCKAVYKKLGINSRAELFLMFGNRQSPAETDVPLKKS